jgi:hypothetical protein
MSIDLEHESLISLAAAAKILPGRPSIPTLWRWRSRGVGGVRLETVVIGGRRYTSHEAIAKFIAGTTAARDGPPAPLTGHARTGNRSGRGTATKGRNLTAEKTMYQP